MQRWNKQPSLKGTGFQQPLAPHEHWHVDVSYINVSGTFYYLCSLLDGASRFMLHWEIREAMKESDVQIVMQRAREAFHACFDAGLLVRLVAQCGLRAPLFDAGAERAALLNLLQELEVPA